MAAEVIAKQPFQSRKDQFHIPLQNGKPVSYLCGHSLGLQPKEVVGLIENELDIWKEKAALGYFQGDSPWVKLSERLSSRLASLVGAQSIEVVAMNSLTVNLHLMLTSFYKPTAKRYKILIESDAFPSDRYAVESQLQLHGYDPKQSIIQLKASNHSHKVDLEELDRVLKDEGDSIALALLPGVQYFTGQVFPIEQMTKRLKEKGIVSGWDLAHAVGNIPLALHDWQLDFAVWCHYKYLNSGPGAVGGCFVHAEHAQQKNIFRLKGWWGNDFSSKLNMQEAFNPYPSALGWQISNAPVFSLVPLKATLKLMDEVGGISALRQRSESLTSYLYQEIKSKFTSDVEILTPEAVSERGCQISIALDHHGKEICKYLVNQGVIVDFRYPNVIRMAPVPLYNDEADIDRCVNCLVEALTSVAK